MSYSTVVPKILSHYQKPIIDDYNVLNTNIVHLIKSKTTFINLRKGGHGMLF